MTLFSILGPFLGGLLFALGLAFSGMTQPKKIHDFLDFFGSWDPSLIFVMGGAVLVSAIGFLSQKKMKQPFFSSDFQLPTNRTIDFRLLLGAFLFGVGWAVGGYCPGPAITSLVTLKTPVIVFVVSMAIGIGVEQKLFSKSK